MSKYFNPDNASFVQAVNSSVYVDKTGLLKYTNKILCSENKCLAVSHARRFGKSQAAGMIDAYYSVGSDSRELFSKFEIGGTEDFLTHLNKYNVIHLDISTFAGNYPGELIEQLQRYLYDDLLEEYPDVDYSKSISDVLLSVYKASGRMFVIIIDEWDCVVRNQSDRPDLVHRYLQFLHDLFKSEESKTFLALAYITGIMPIKKVKDESALNNFFEYTMVDSTPITQYFGFTEDEVKALCQEYDMSFSSVKTWYNGYLLDGMHMFNPNSVSMAMTRRKLSSYWKNTSAFSTINDFITLNYDGLKDEVLTMLAGGRVRVNVSTFQNDLSVIRSKNEALTALIHLGYLAYDGERKQAYIPNYEVSDAFQAALETGSWTEVSRSIAHCEDLLWATIDGEEAKVAMYLEQAHEAYTSIFKYNDENSLACILTMAYFTAPAYYNVVREMPAGKGFADLAFIPRRDAGNKPAMIIELKVDKAAESAIQQIKERRYTGALKGYADRVLLVGISYDRKSKEHSCVIEEALLRW